MSSFPISQVRTPKSKVAEAGDTSIYHLSDWGSLSHVERLKVLRQIAMGRGRSPEMAALAVKIFREAKVAPRDYEKQAAAILAWVQNPKNVYYVNEPGERLQDPFYTVKVGLGDCDDQAILLACLFESVGLPWRFVLSGLSRKDRKKTRFIEGGTLPERVNWTHIYCVVGTPPFTTKKWFFCEPTIVGVPLGWDAVSGDKSYLPEMDPRMKNAKPKLYGPKKAPARFRPAALPPENNRSPAYAVAYGATNMFGVGAGAAVAADIADGAGSTSASPGVRREDIIKGIIIGTTVSLATSLLQPLIEPVVEAAWSSLVNRFMGPRYWQELKDGQRS